MNRRELIKAVAAVVFIPSLPIGREPLPMAFPIRFKYNGFDVRVNEVWKMGIPCRQIYAEKTIRGKRYCGAILFDKEDSLPKIEKIFKVWLDRTERRAA